MTLSARTLAAGLGMGNCVHVSFQLKTPSGTDPCTCCLSLWEFICSFVALEGEANFLKLSDISPYEFGIVYLFAH